jgi:hypothetical protein
MLINEEYKNFLTINFDNYIYLTDGLTCNENLIERFL